MRLETPGGVCVATCTADFCISLDSKQCIDYDDPMEEDGNRVCKCKNTSTCIDPNDNTKCVDAKAKGYYNNGD